MKIVYGYLLFFIVLSSQVVAKNSKVEGNKNNTKPSVELFMTSQSYSDILPVKQLIEDDWQQAPLDSASEGFTQNEVGVRAYWNNFSFSVSHRYDYFVYSNSDTAEAFYLERNKQALDTQESYDIDLKLFHHRSNGLRLGYTLAFDKVSIDARMGYWELDATRESYLTGSLTSDLQGNISGIMQLEELYSDRNFLKRANRNNSWDTDGSGITFDLHLAWQPINSIKLTADLKDLYSDFSIDNSGYSTGTANTDGTYINSVGGIAYLPLYQGVESTKSHEFELPKQVDITGVYTTKNIGYITRIKRQGEHNFYYLGLGFQHEGSSTRVLFDIENTAPEIQYTNHWFSCVLSIDDLDIEQAHLFNLSLSANYTF